MAGRDMRELRSLTSDDFRLLISDVSLRLRLRTCQAHINNQKSTFNNHQSSQSAGLLKNLTYWK
jgi:hypothetical protein